MFAKPAVEEPSLPNNPEKLDLRMKAEEFIKTNPSIMALYLKFARELKERGRRFGIGFLTERIRWECYVKSNEKFKICNNHRAYIARWLIARDPELEAFMTFRETKW